jgi:BMFP domain-containing protein YqiC
MSNFEKVFSDFTNLISGMSSVAGGLKTEMEQNFHQTITNFMQQAGFVKRDEFDNLVMRFEELAQRLKVLEAQQQSSHTQNNDL